jgi:pilus assembly protein FimV
MSAFGQAGIEFNPVLAGVRFAIERRDGRALIRLTTTQPVNEPFLGLLVELQWATGRLIREYTVLLSPPEYKGPPIAALRVQ